MKQAAVKHLVIPDVQAKPGVPLDHMEWAGRYARDKRPDVIVLLGDVYDMHSLCEYDRATRPREFHSRSYADDLSAGDTALRRFTKALGRRTPQLVYCLGNHEWRYDRLVRLEPRLQSALRPPWQYAEQLGWDVVPYLEPRVIDGVAYCHQFVRSANGLVTSTKYGAPNARTQVMREMRSCTAGHKPGLDTHIQALGTRIVRGTIAGSFYQHEEEYQTPQGNAYWRGILMKHEVREGQYDLLEVSLGYLRRRYA